MYVLHVHNDKADLDHVVGPVLRDAIREEGERKAGAAPSVVGKPQRHVVLDA
jgi:hypothetical protein